MRYRRFGSLDWEVSVLGLGVAGLPLGDREPRATTEPAAACEPECVRMIRRAIDQGVNYLDVGRPYDMVRQESLARMVGRALQDGYRERVRIALTAPASVADSAKGFDHRLDTQLDWLQTDSVDFCVLSRLDRESWPQAKEKGLLTRAERAISAGKVGSLGFAFHDHFQILRQVLKGYDRWAFAQFQFSYMDAGRDPGASGLAYAADQGLAVVVTEPFKGGRLARVPPDSVRRIWESAPEQRSPADWGLRYVWNHPAVSTAVCGVSGIDQLVKDLALAEEAEAGALSVRDELTINKVRDAYNELRTIDCASCRPCMPCPQGLDVPRIFEIYNDAITYGDVETARSIYRDEGHRADECAECGICERKCCRRQPLPIMALLKTAADLLGGGE